MYDQTVLTSEGSLGWAQLEVVNNTEAKELMKLNLNTRGTLASIILQFTTLQACRDQNRSSHFSLTQPYERLGGAGLHYAKLGPRSYLRK